VDLIPHAYSLEVSSPGIERPLRGAADYVRFTGQKAKLRLRDPVGGQRQIVGILEGVVDGKVQVSESGRTHQVPLPSIDRARLLFELTAQPKNVSRQKQSEKSKQRKH
jgi:ribosome maturation factor RimP